MALNVPRATPSYNVPPSQNTAPVLEFRCLYTHDVFKKQKKWHDGSLKFHTFNRRVMVYDDVKNYIGDLHYRQDDDFGEGLELQLDRGVKVEVGEPLGQTHTDLTPLLEKGRPPRDSGSGSIPRPAQNASARVIQRVNATNSQGRLKSLTEVLGASQGRVGRARLPLQSPYEQRQALSAEQDNAPPAKRQRISAGKENVSLSPKAVEARPQVNDKSRGTGPRDQVLQSRPISQNAAKVTASAPGAVIDVSSDEDIRTNVTKRKIDSGKAVDNPLSRTSANHATIQPMPAPSTKPPHNRAQAKVDSNARRKEKEDGKRNGSNKTTAPSAESVPRSPPKNPVTDARANLGTSKPSMRPGMVALKMIEQPPRRKLMYRASLPSSRAARSTAFAQTPSRDQREGANSLIAGRIQSSRDHMAELKDHNSLQQIFELDDIDDESDMDDAKRADNSSNKAHEVKTRPTSTPMFFSQESSIMLPPSPPPEQDDCDLDFDFGENGNEADVATTELDQSAADGDGLRSNAFFGQSPSTQETAQISLGNQKTQSPLLRRPHPPQSPPVHEHPAATDQLLAPTSASKAQPLRRVVSENDSPLLAHRASPPFKEAPVVTSPARQQLTQTAHKSPARQSFQRAQSDTAVLNTDGRPVPIVPITPLSCLQPAVQQEQQQNQEQPPDQGPWSRLEAFLLFDDWPAAKAKDKPVYPARATHDVPSPAKEDFDEYNGIEMDDRNLQLSIDASARTSISTRARARARTKIGPPMTRSGFGPSAGAGSGGGNKNRVFGIRSARSMLHDEM